MVQNTGMIELRNVSYTPEGRDTPLLRELNWKTTSETPHIVLGASASGKSTFASILAGLVPRLIWGRLTGDVFLLGRSVQSCAMAELATIRGLLFQRPELMFCNLHVRDEVAFGLENIEMPLPEMRIRVSELLAATGLAGLDERRIDRLSGGQTQRLALVCAVATDPRVLILDEPYTNLDPQTQHGLGRVLRELRHGKGLSVTFAKELLKEDVTEAQISMLHDGTLTPPEAGPAFLHEWGEQILQGTGIGLPDASALALQLRRRFPDLWTGNDRIPWCPDDAPELIDRSEEHTSELQSLS